MSKLGIQWGLEREGEGRGEEERGGEEMHSSMGGSQADISVK